MSRVVGETVSLERAGREWKACCPFHKEKTPSFVVNDQKGFYHCFGCGAHGDVIGWLTDARGRTFMEAVKELADAAGMKVPSPESASQEQAVAAASASGSTVPVKKGGGKLTRSETVTVRLDPKLNYLCELAARTQRRTKSSFIEWAIADALGSVSLPEVTTTGEAFDDVREVTIREKASQLWHVDEADRLVALALIAPALLTHEEQLIWRLVRENGYLWRGRFNKEGDWTWEVSEDKLIRDRLRDSWDTFRAVALSELSKDYLPGWEKSRAAALDEDVPF